jgi:hypothetical protein
MKQLHLTILLCCLLHSPSGQVWSQPGTDTTPETSRAESRRLNFFIISKRAKGKLDPATRFNVLRAKWRSFFRPRRFVAIVAADMAQASEKMRYRLLKYRAAIGTVWFDSHGLYKKGYSLFMVGRDEVSHKSLKEPNLQLSFARLSPFCDSRSSFVIGSCYGGATYIRSSVDYRDTTRMNGDSLMMALGQSLGAGVVYGSESWVMTKPGLFNRKPAVGGFPGRRLFLDLCYRPVWEHVGRWNRYRVGEERVQAVNPVALDPTGQLVVRGKPYQEEKKVTAVIRKNLDRLEPGLYH